MKQSCINKNQNYLCAALSTLPNGRLLCSACPASRHRAQRLSGAGKTTLLNHMLHNREGLKVAVIVNDMSEVNLDAQQIAREGGLSRTEERLVQMSNGCICCTLREDLMLEVTKLARERRFDYLLIERTGISEPLPVAQTFSFVSEDGTLDLGRHARLDTLVTVVDAFNFGRDVGSLDRLPDHQLLDADPEDQRTIVNLLTEQVEFANVIVLNKADLVPAATLSELRAVLRKLNPSARFVEASFGQVPLAAILNTQLFNQEEAEQTASWQQELARGHHPPETEDYGIGSFVFRDSRPFHPARFWEYVREEWPGEVIRSKGLFWLGSRPTDAPNWGQASGSLRAKSAGSWWAAIEQPELHPAFLDNRAPILSRWDQRFQDRVNELVFIGQDMDEPRIQRELQACLCTEAEVSYWQRGGQFADPLPAF
jgi:G3E family GTPase